MSKQRTPVLHVDPVEEDDITKENGSDFLLFMQSLKQTERRAVYALRGLWEDYKTQRKELLEAINCLKRANAEACGRLFDIREAIVTGARELTTDELQAVALADPAALEGDDAETKATKATKETEPQNEKNKKGEASLTSSSAPSKGVKVVAPSDETTKSILEVAAANPRGGIPHFWLTAMCNSDIVEGMITERDRAALACLTNIATEYIEGDPHKGVRLVFSFAPNEYFTNATLTKTYRMSFNEEDGDLDVEKIEGCDIDWTSKEKNLTITLKDKKQRNKKTNQIRIVKREEPCMSFFNFFSPPKDEGVADDDEEDEEEHEQDWQMDMEAGQELMEQITPKAAFFYAGKSVDDVAELLLSHYDYMGDDEEDEDEEEDDEEEEEEDKEEKKGFPKQGSDGRGKGKPTPKSDECKQQ